MKMKKRTTSNRVHTPKKITTLGLFIWLLASLFFLYEFFSRTFVGTLAEGVMHNLHISALQLSLIGAIYYLAYSGMQIPVGIIIDRWGVKKPLIAAACVCALGVYLFAHATGFKSLLASRFLMGFGSSFAFVSLLILALNWFPKRNFGFFSGATEILGAIGPILAGAPLVAILHLTHGNWQLVLAYIAIGGALLAILFLLFLRDHPKGFHEIKTQAVKSPTLHNLKSLFKNKQVLWIVFYAFCSYASISLLGAIWGTYYLQTLGIPRDSAATTTSMIWLGLAIGSPLIGFISDRIKRIRGPLLICALFSALFSTAIIFSPYTTAAVYAFLYFGLGFFGAGQTLSFVCLLSHVAPNQRATAMGLNNTSIMLGGVIIPPLVGLAVQFSAHRSLHHAALSYSRHDFMLGLSIMPIICLIGAAIIFLKVKNKPHSH